MHLQHLLSDFVRPARAWLAHEPWGARGMRRALLLSLETELVVLGEKLGARDELLSVEGG